MTYIFNRLTFVLKKNWERRNFVNNNKTSNHITCMRFKLCFLKLKSQVLTTELLPFKLIYQESSMKLNA